MGSYKKDNFSIQVSCCYGFYLMKNSQVISKTKLQAIINATCAWGPAQVTSCLGKKLEMNKLNRLPKLLAFPNPQVF